MPDFIVTSATATQEEVEHAVSADWRTPLPVPEPKKTEAEPEANAEPVAAEEVAETAPDSEPETTQERPVKGKGGFQKKIDKLTKEKAEASSRAEMLEQELASFKERFAAIEQRLAKPAETEKPAKAATVEHEPLESEIGTVYKDWNEYLDARIEYRAKKIAETQLEAKLADRDKTAEQREREEIQQERTQNWKVAAKEFAEKVAPDYNEKIEAATKAGMKLPEPIIEKIQELENGPAVTYYLVTNPDEALALIQMDAADGFIALGRIAQGLAREEVKEKPVPAKKVVSTAPAPVKPVAGQSARSTNSLQDVSKQGTDEYIRVRQAQIRERDQRRYS